jgi:hypothetical protein
MRKNVCLAALSLCLLACALTGCSSGVSSLISPAVKASAMSGSIHGGNQPVSGATIQIYAPGKTGYGSTATPLITGAPLLTGADGGFNFGNRGLSCPSGPGGQDRLYLTATGGNPGFSGAANNDALFLMTIIDSCQALTTSSFFSVSEVSTVASIYALAQFMDPATGSIGSYGSSTVGLNNAFDMAVTLFNPATGQAYTTTPSGGGSGQVPQTTIDTLANIIAPCVNSTSSTSASCAALFPLTTNTTPSNTGLAALQMALHPGTNVSALYTLALATAPYQPALTSTPNDLTLSVSYHTGAASPSSLAIDGLGNVWLADYETGGSTSRLLKVSPVGVPTIFTTSAAGIKNVAIDSKNNVWGLFPDSTPSPTVTEFNNAGSSVTTFTASNTGNPVTAIAIDAGDNPWVSDSGSHVSEVNVINTQNVAFGGTLVNPAVLSFDNSGNAWIPNSGANSITKISAAGNTLGTFTGGGLASPGVTAVDSTGNIYAGNTSGSALSEFNSSGTPVSSSGYTFPSVGSTSNIAADGSGHLWSAGTGGVLGEVFNGALVSPASGYRSTGINQPGGIGVDSSGNVWVMDKLHTTVNGTFVNLVKFVGIATPATTPLTAAVQSAQVGVAAGTPIPVAVASTALPYYTVGTVYVGKLVATGGTGAYTWTSGTLPTGLTMSSAGVISGTPTGTAATVNFTVTDTALPSNTASRSIALNTTTALPAGANAANLNGHYAVLLKGFKSSTASTTGGVSGYAAVGSLIFNGTGGVTSATFDYNGTDGAGSVTVTGSYNLGSDLRGTLLLTESHGVLPHQYVFSVANGYKTLYITSSDSPGAATYSISSGIGKLQTTTDFTAAVIQNNFVFGLDGETPCSSPSPCPSNISSYGRLSMGGLLKLGVTTLTGIEDGAALNTSYPQITLTGSHGNPNATSGRGTMNFIYGGTNMPSAPTTFTYYIVNAGELMIMSSAVHTTGSLLVGHALKQTQTFSSTTSANQGIFNGNYVVMGTTAKGGDGSLIYPMYTDDVLVLATSAGTGTTTVVQDENQAGLITTESTLGTAPYTIDANGRLLLTGASIAIYLANSGGGFGTQQPNTGNGGSAAGMLTVEQQTGSGSFSCGTLVGAYSFGSDAPVTQQTVSSGSINFSSGTGSAVVDEAAPSGALARGVSNTFTCASDASSATSGRLSYTDASGDPSVGYLVSPSTMMLLGTKANDTKAGITIVTAQ